MRVFVALPLPDPVTERLGQVTGRLSFGRPVPPENMHVTLAFFADLTAQQVQDAIDALEMLQAWPFDIEISGLDVLGGAIPGLLAAHVVPGTELEALHSQVHALLRGVGLIEARRRRFHPHVTLLRLGSRLADIQQAQVQDCLSDHGSSVQESCVADRVCVYRSHLGTSPPVYETLAECPLAPWIDEIDPD